MADRQPFSLTVRCETCDSCEHIAFAPADPEAIAAMVAAATVAEAMLHGHRVDVGWEYREMAPTRSWDLPGVMTKIA